MQEETEVTKPARVKDWNLKNDKEEAMSRGRVGERETEGAQNVA